VVYYLTKININSVSCLCLCDSVTKLLKVLSLNFVRDIRY